MCKNYLEGEDCSISILSYQLFCLIIYISYIYIYFYDKENFNIFSIIILLMFYISNIIVQFVSVGFRKFLCIQNLKSILYNNIQNKFTVTIKAESWHTTFEGENNTPTRHTTFKEKVIFEFNSGCDNTVEIIRNELIKPHHKYLDLEITYNLECLDNWTQNEYNYVYNNLLEKARIADESHSINVIIGIKNGHSKNIVSLTNGFNRFLDIFLFIIFIFLSLGQIYKYILSCFIIEKKIVIRKIISNYYNLTSNEISNNMKPTVICFGEELYFDKNLFSFANRDGLGFRISEQNNFSPNLHIINISDIFDKTNNEEKLELNENLV